MPNIFQISACSAEQDTVHSPHMWPQSSPTSAPEPAANPAAALPRADLLRLNTILFEHNDNLAAAAAALNCPQIDLFTFLAQPHIAPLAAEIRVYLRDHACRQLLATLQASFAAITNPGERRRTVALMIGYYTGTLPRPRAAAGGSGRQTSAKKNNETSQSGDRPHDEPPDDPDPPAPRRPRRNSSSADRESRAKLIAQIDQLASSAADSFGGDALDSAALATREPGRPGNPPHQEPAIAGSASGGSAFSNSHLQTGKSAASALLGRAGRCTDDAMSVAASARLTSKQVSRGTGTAQAHTFSQPGSPGLLACGPPLQRWFGASVGVELVTASEPVFNGLLGARPP